MKAAALLLLLFTPRAGLAQAELLAAPSAVVLPAVTPLAFAPVSAPAAALSGPSPFLSASLPTSAPALAAPAAAPSAAPDPVPLAAAAAAAPAPAIGRAPEDSSVDARRLWDGAGRMGAAVASAALAERLVTGRGNAAFTTAVRAHISSSFPPAAVAALLQAGYRVEAARRLRDARPALDASHDFLSGYHSHDGADGKLVLIAEQTKNSATGKWERSDSWENAVDHELGLALARALGDTEAALVAPSDPRQADWYRAAGIAESPALRDAWRRDFQAMPDDLKSETDHDGTPNPFYYYLKPDKNGWFQTARRRTFAEGLDVLLRGRRSVYNYADFTRYFPLTLAAMRRELDARFGWPLPEPARAAPRAPRADPALDSAALARRLVTGGASPAFVAKIRAHVAATFPPAVLRDLLDGGYQIEARRSVRQGRPHLHEDNDYTGGFHSHGESTSYIVVAEKIRLRESDSWVDSAVWENAINHEIGHALAYLLGEAESASTQDPRQALWYRKKGLSESPAFRAAWWRDYEAIPADLKQPWRDRLENQFFYFVHPDAGGWFQRARQETFAEGVDILLRGPRSKFNYDNFTRRFPNALAEIRRELESRYGPMFPAP
jgi:hypothetical protein